MDGAGARRGEELARLAAPLDPQLLETLHWTRNVGHRAQEAPDPRFAKRLERELLQAFPASASAATGSPWPPTGAPADDRRGFAPL